MEAREIEELRVAATVADFCALIQTEWPPPGSATVARARRRQNEVIRAVEGGEQRLLDALEADEKRQTALGWDTQLRAALRDSSTQNPEDLETWLSELDSLITLTQSRLPVRRRLHDERNNAIRRTASRLKGQGRALREQASAAAVTDVDNTMIAELSNLGAKLPALWRDAVANNARSESLDWWRPSWTSQRPDMLAAPVVCPAAASLQTLDATVSIDATSPSSRRHSLKSSVGTSDDIAKFQLRVDLDRDGGFVTNDKVAIEAACIDLLGQLPGGRVKIEVFDPVRLGDSASFLYDLNDAGDRILADVVWTTSDQISRALLRIEEHITFVTQKYLQGRDSLTEYNLEAGEIAEPYRLLMLYDFPAGFSRDGRNYDDEHLARLKRLCAVGRRAGVYIFVHTPAFNADRIDCVASLVWLTPSHLHLGGPMAAQAMPDGPASTPNDHTVGAASLSDLQSRWTVIGSTPPSSAQRGELFARLLRELQQGENTRVEPATLIRLADAKRSADIARGLVVEHSIDLNDPGTWWQSSSTDRLQISFGRLGASDLARIEFNSALESSALIGGRTGSGKSYLLHAIIMDAITRYSPEELNLYLCDLKEGVEFKQYADASLPHARAIAIESNREFAVSVLEAMDDEIAVRGAAFKERSGGTSVNIARFRRESGQIWPRVIIVIDEFHKLFEQDDRLARRAMQLLERVIKEGRAFGVHALLASQTLANVDASFKNLAGQIPYRLVLASSDGDSRLLLGEDNADAKLLTRAGEGILNAKGGAKESNQRFQTVYWSPESRQRVLTEILRLAARSGLTNHRPHIFEGNAAVLAGSYPPDIYRGDGTSVTIPVGAPMSMAPPVFAALERAPGGNLLVIDPEGLGIIATIVTSLLAQRVSVLAIDFASIESDWESAFDALAAAGMIKQNRRRIDDTVDALSTIVADRHVRGVYKEESKVLILIGIHRARELDPENYEEDSLHAKLQTLAKDGPEVGVHVIVWADRKASLDRRVGSSTLREFGLRMLGRMGQDDSRALIDTEQASSISDAQLVFDNFDRAVTMVVRRLGFSGNSWIEDVAGGDGAA